MGGSGGEKEGAGRRQVCAGPNLKLLRGSRHEVRPGEGPGSEDPSPALGG